MKSNWSEIYFFNGLSNEEIEKFINSTHSKIKKHSKGERVIKAFNPNFHIGILISGTAQIISLDRFGNETIGHNLSKGSILGITSAVLGESALSVSIELTSDSEILWIPYQSLLVSGSTLGRIHGLVMKNFLESFCKKSVLMMQKIELLSQKSLREKIIVYLIQREKNQQSEKVSVPGRVQLAKELECHRSALTRELAQMQSEGLISCSENWICLNKEKVK